MVFKKGGKNKGNLYFTSWKLLNVLSISVLFFTTGDSFNATYESLHGQALNSLFTSKSYLIRFPNMTVIHNIDLFEKHIEQILNYSYEIWNVNEAVKLVNIHMHFL